jgi:DnaB-like helicase N terminal domain/AAA domain
VAEQLVPNDLVAEASLLGAMILSREAVADAIDICTHSDFYSPRNGSVFNAIRDLYKSGANIDVVTVAAKLNDNELVSVLTSMVLDVPSVASVNDYANIVYKHSVARTMMMNLGNALNSVRGGLDPFTQATELERFLSSVGNIHNGEPESLTLDELASKAEALAPVVIPGMMHRDYRTIVVAEEGAGKSLLLRTIAMASSQGYHPFSHQRIKPVRVLVVDLENPTQAITQTAVPYMNMLRMRDGLGTDPNYDPERLRFWRQPGGIEIRRASDKSALQREIAFHRPELVCIGPIYKMYRRGNNESYEDSADEAMAVLDDLRTKYEFALIMEHHAAKGKAGEKRELSPMGSQRWMAWPEIGISLYKDERDPTMMHVKRYRGDRLSGVSWPDRIIRDKNWLVEGAWD